MSLINKFSVAYKIDKANKKKERNQNNTTVKVQIIEEEVNRDFISSDVVEALLNFGYTLEQIMISFKEYKYISVEEALFILMRDPETSKFNHKFRNSNNVQNKNYERMTDINSRCILCNEPARDHIDLDVEQLNSKDMRLDIGIERRNKLDEEIKETTTNLQNRTNLDVDVSVITDKKFNDIKLPQFKEIEIPKETLDMFEDPNVCRICFSEVLEENNKAQFPCGHKFCKTCVTNHINININNGKVLLIKCLYGGCPKTFVDEEIKEFTDEETFIKYRRFKIVQIRMNNPDRNYINCPIPDCEEMMEAANMGDSDDYMMECNSGHKFCSNCKTQGWHKKGKCINYGNNLLKEIQKNSDGTNYKQCPQCTVIIEKNEGCNQMKCSNCNFEFCWLCMKRYSNDHYAIYNFTGCPGMRFSYVEKKNWWDNKWLKCLWFILSFFIGILVVCLLILFFALFGCAYEFVKCYTNRKTGSEDEDQDQYYSNNNENENHSQPEQQAHHSNLEEGEKKNSYAMISFLVFLGILCQPFYLIFYLLYGLMECYRRFSCWFYYVDY